MNKKISVNVPRASQGNRAFRRHASRLTKMKAPKGVQDDPKKIIKLVHSDTMQPCKNGCGNNRQHGSSRCKKCAQPNEFSSR